MLKIAVVGDLSLQDPSRLEAAMHAAYDDADIICQIGDMHPGYSVVKKYVSLGAKPVYAVCGNHDTDWDTQLHWPRQWRHDTDDCHLIGLDNHADSFNAQDWYTLSAVPDDGKPLLLFVHKPLSTIVLPDGSESSHIMGEGIINADSLKMQDILSKRNNVLCVHGHYHAWSLMKTEYADCLIEGRGGASSELGYTVIIIRSEGIVIHPKTI